MATIHTLARLLTTIQRFTDEQTDQLQDLLGFGYNPDDAHEALNQLQALRDLPPGVIDRVHEWVKVIDKTNGDWPCYTLLPNDLKLLLRGAGVLHVDSGKIRIGHPTKGVESKLDQQARDAGVPEDLIGLEERRRIIREAKAKAAEEWHEQPEGGYTVTPAWSTNIDGSHNHGDLLPPPVRAEYVAEGSLAEELKPTLAQINADIKAERARRDAELKEAKVIETLRPHQRAGEHRTLKQARKERFEAGQKLKAAGERWKRREALVEAFRDGRKPKEALVEAVNAVMDLQDYVIELKRPEPTPPLIGYKIVPKNAIVIDVDQINGQIREAVDKMVKDLQSRGY